MADFEPSIPLRQRVSFNNENHIYDAESASSSESDEADEYDEYEEETDETPPEQVVNKPTKAVTSQRRNSPAQNVYLPPELVKFHEDFRSSFTLPPPLTVSATSATRSTMSSESVPPRLEINELDLVPVSDQASSSTVPAKRRGVAYVKPSKKAKSNEPASAGEEHSSALARKSLSERKAPSTLPKGSGIYKTGTWEYAPDEDGGVEKYDKVVSEMAATIEASSSKPAKLTRNSFRNLKSEIQRSSVGTTPSQEPPVARQTARVSGSPRVSKTLSPRRGSSATPTRPEQGRRKSNRARIIPNYSHVPDIEIDEDIPTPTASSSAEEATRQKTPSAIQSPASQRSTPPLGRPSRSKSPSADQESDLNPKRMAKPKKSWTHIVYEVIANSTRPTLTLQELGEAIMDRFPFFRSKPEILKSSPRNPLYCHPAFYKVTRDDKSLAWGIKPGQFFDKRTNKLLTAGTPGPDVVPSIEVSEQIIAETQQDPAADETPSSVSRSVEVEIKYDEPVKSPSLSRNGVEETQQDSVTRTVIEIDPRNIPDETMVSPRNVQQSSLPPSTEAEIEVKSTPQPSGPVFPQSRDQRRLAGLVHQDLVDTFSSEDMDRFLQETKLCYFKNMALKKEDVHQILESIFPNGLRSSEEDLETCTSDLRKDFEDRTWSSDWFIKFVTEEVTRFDTNMEGFMKHMDRPKPIRLDFWAAQTRWKRANFSEMFSPAFGDTVDLDRIWTTKHWHDFARKVFQTACDATWEHRLEPGTTTTTVVASSSTNTNKVMAKVQAAIHERYPDRSGSKIWDVPRVHRVPVTETMTHSRKTSFASTTAANSNRRPGSSAGGVGGFSRAGSFSNNNNNRPSSPLVPNSQETVTGTGTAFTPLNGGISG